MNQMKSTLLKGLQMEIQKKKKTTPFPYAILIVLELMVKVVT